MSDKQPPKPQGTAKPVTPPPSSIPRPTVDTINKGFGPRTKDQKRYWEEYKRGQKREPAG